MPYPSTTPTNLATFAAAIDGVLTESEPQRSAALDILSAGLRRAAWTPAAAPRARELATAAELAMHPNADLLEGLRRLVAIGALKFST